MAEKIEVEIEVQTNAEEAGGKVKKLSLQLREAKVAFENLQNSGTATAASLKKAADDIDDVADKIDKARFSSGQFEDKIASLPGPLGKLGGGLKSVKDAFTTFGTSLTVSLGIVGLLVTAFFAIKNALGKTEEGTKALSAVTSAFNKILAPIFAIFEKLGLAILPIVTKGFEAVGAVMAKVSKFFGVSAEKIDETTASLEKGNEAANTLATAEEARLKKSEEAAAKAAEAAKKRKEEADKAAADKKKRDEEAAKLLLDGNQVLSDAYVATLSQRDQEIYAAGVKQNERLAKLQAAGLKDNTSVLEQGRIEKDAINKKYDDEEAAKKKEKDDKDLEAFKKKSEDERGILLSNLEAKLEALDRENQQSDFDFAADLQRLGEQRDILKQQEATELENTELTEFQKTEIRKKYADARRGITDQEVATEKAAAQAKHEINMQYLDLVGQFGNLLSQIAGKNKALAISGIVISQAASIAKIVASTAAGIAALTPGLPFTAPSIIATKISAGLGIVSTIAAAAKAIKEINATPGPSGGGGGGGGSASAPAIMAPSVAGMAAPQIQTQAGQNPTSQIANTLASASGKTIKTYVVANDVSSQQALDRRTSKASTFG